MISKITRVEIFKNTSNSMGFSGGFNGYKIYTDKEGQVMNIKIDNFQGCCETWNIETNIPDEEINEKFVDAEIYSVKIISNTEIIKNRQYGRNRIEGKGKDIEGDRIFDYFREIDNCGDDCGGKIGVLIKTSKGILPIFAYNFHNGYYEHDLIINWNIYIDGTLRILTINKHI